MLDVPSGEKAILGTPARCPLKAARNLPDGTAQRRATFRCWRWQAASRAGKMPKTKRHPRDLPAPRAVVWRKWTIGVALNRQSVGIAQLAHGLPDLKLLLTVQHFR